MYAFPITLPAQKTVLAINVLFIILPFAAVCLRLYARHQRRIPIDASDCCIIVALLLSNVFMITGIVMVVNCGLGFEQTVVTAEHGEGPMILFRKFLVIMQLLWSSSLALVKVSILLFYVRIFAVGKFIIAAKFTAGFIVAWAISVFLCVFLLCRPFAYNWDATITGTCGNSILSYVILGAVNLMTDLVLLSLPLPYIWTLRLRFRIKIALTITFTIGIGASIFSILRIISLTTVSEAHLLKQITEPLIWGELEPAIGIILACTPMIKPLILGDSSRNRSSPVNSQTCGSSTKGLSGQRSFKPLDDQDYPLRPIQHNDGQSENENCSYAASSVTEEGLHREPEFAKDAIQVRSEWTVRKE
ncbi:uncharacterized protein PAC_20184 [Phialocephala subalpina]|uniref:Rhodopsin domain-containing protein n=1 Tax=Phialocephala subalpina TaxID=576137 RepID=A0A1L7XYZ0_9HELO|nr:uncharacterized protein PAC_20184 [Phialocephala subalpina]